MEANIPRIKILRDRRWLSVRLAVTSWVARTYEVQMEGSGSVACIVCWRVGAERSMGGNVQERRRLGGIVISHEFSDDDDMMRRECER